MAMGYVRDSLGANEAIHYIAHFHWIRYALPYGVLLLAILVSAFTYDAAYPLLMLGPVAVGVVLFIAMMVPIWTTEIGVTSQRLIYKRGLIQRETQEMQLRSVEQVSLEQDVLGRILGYGWLEIHGTGEEEIILPAIGDPIAMRRALQEALGQIQGNAARVDDDTLAQSA
jgi:uncharacterized membrane protein YdbT with pleckstrin-like domain